ncbi:MAG: RsmD family RNA methyltransferase [Ignisphaera sp.]
MEYYVYRYINGVTISVWDVEEIISRIKKGETRFKVTVDLGLRETDIEYRNGVVVISGDTIDINELNAVREGFLYKLIDSRLHRLDMYSDGKYYKLRPVARNKAPTIEINGIHMHRIQSIDPWTDSFTKIRSISRRIKNARVLDICTGLGYTAIAEVMFGAKSVVTVELDSNVLYLASLNPWSRKLEDPKISIVLGDAFNVLDELGEEDFDVVVHDPPRFEIAGELYSYEFYKKVYRVLKKNGVFVHYTGNPAKHSNIDIIKGIKNRLSRAGFSEIHWIESIKGFKAIKVT